jgi:hypothetical protein
VPGTFSYKSDSTAETASKILAASSYSLTATFKPTSTADYGDATATAPLTVDQAPTTTTFTSTNPTITLSASGTASRIESCGLARDLSKIVYARPGGQFDLYLLSQK